MKNHEEHLETSRFRRRLSRTVGLTIVLAVAAFTIPPAMAQHLPSTVDQSSLDRIETFAAQPPAPVRLTVPPGVETAIPIKTLPNGVCTLHPEGSDDPAQSVTLYADQEGLIRFHVRPASRSDVHARLEARCRADDQVAVVSIELRAETAPIPSMPAPSDLDLRARPGASSIRPALEGDPMQISDEELRRRGYPPRPDPGTAPELYASWLKAVTRPVTVIAPQAGVRSDRIHGPARRSPQAESIRSGPASSSNWSGFIATGSSGTYKLVAGDWLVPSVVGEPLVWTYSSLWIGLDGYLDGSGNPCTNTTCDVVQDGTEQDVFTYDLFGMQMQVTNYFPWAEVYPDKERPLPLQVNPLDEIFSEVWFDGTSGWFYIEDVTTASSIEAYEPLKGALALAPPPGSTATFVGNSAEWIMERPLINNALPDLALYDAGRTYPRLFYATMIDAYTYQNGNWVAYGSDPDVQAFMYNGVDLLSTVFADSCAGCMTFRWEAFSKPASNKARSGSRSASCETNTLGWRYFSVENYRHPWWTIHFGIAATIVQIFMLSFAIIPNFALRRNQAIETGWSLDRQR